jgi:hypothetical protein
VGHESSPEFLRQADLLGREPHVLGPSRALFLRDLQTVVRTPHHGEATTLATVQRGTPEQFDQPEGESVGMLVPRMPEEGQ